MDNLQDLVKYIRSMKRLKAVLMEGEPLGVFSERARSMSPKCWGKFWQIVVEGVKRSLCQSVQHLKNLFPTPRQDALRYHCIQQKILEVDSQPFTFSIKLSRDPPKVFFPIPKIETGGCARSDSLVRSLIF